MKRDACVLVVWIFAVVATSVALAYEPQDGFDVVNEIMNTTIPEEYAPEIVPEKFGPVIDNPYSSFPVGKRLVYQAETHEGLERIEVEATAETKLVMGVETMVVRHREWLDGVLVEDTRDFLAQDERGNVWYFGEEVDNYADGEIDNHDGAWLAGENGAQPGLWMMAVPVEGVSYHQEYLPGEAEDMALVKVVGLSMTIQGVVYDSCIKVMEWSPLEPGTREHEYYCQEISGLVREENIQNGERMELIGIEGDDSF